MSAEPQKTPETRMVDTPILKRATVIGGIVIACFLIALLRILLLQTVDYEKYRNKVLNQITTEAEVIADRGKIYDRNGVLLATGVTNYRVFIAPRVIAEASAAEELMYDALIADGLCDILGVSREHIMEQTTHKKYLDRTLARDVDEETAAKVRRFIAANDLENMVFLQAGTKRYYPNGTMACHVLGFTGSDGAGQYGLELSYDEILSGTNGRYITARDSRGNEMPYEYQSYIEAKDGNSIVTTLDVNIQAVLEEQLSTAYIESGGQNRATGIVVDVETGEILAMATYPFFDLNNPRNLNEQDAKTLQYSGLAQGSAEYTALKQELQLTTWSNKAVTEIYMPGSTFKIVTASMAYEENLVDPNHTYPCPGYHIVAGRKIRCHKTTGHGSQTFARGLQNSCNPVLMMMGASIGQERFYNYYRAFGYTEKTGVDLPGEGSSIFFNPATWSELDLATASFGQNFKITPIQQIMAVATVANGGYLMAPHLVKEVLDSEGKTIQTYTPTQKRQVISAATAKELAAILEEGVSGGYGAKNAYVAGYRVAAKTGTSEKIDKQNETGKDNLYVCSCVGFAPADDPKVAVIIMVDEPTKGSLYGSTVAAPYLSNVMRDILPYLGVEPMYTDKELTNLAVKLPDYVGWYTTDAKRDAANRGLDVELVGEGGIIRGQSPEGGTRVEANKGTVVLYTEAGLDRATITVPDVLGKTAVAANEILANRKLNIRIEGTNNYLSGSGAVAVEQFPAAGSEVEIGTVITVTFRNEDEEN